MATTTPQEQRRWAAVREQVGSALRIYAYRDALARAREELHAADDGLLPASAERIGLCGHGATFRGLRDHAIAEALNDHGCPLALAALVGAIGVAKAQRIAREDPLTHAIETSDIVKVSKRGRLFYAVVRGRGPGGQLLVEPIERGISHRHVGAREIVDHWAHARRTGGGERAVSREQLDLSEWLEP